MLLSYSRLIIKKELGQGSMATVYLAEDTERQRYVALKILHHKLVNDIFVKDLFLHEASLLSEFRHINAVPVLGYGKLPDGRLYMVQELARGESLNQLLEQRGPYSLTDACDIIEQILSCLQSAHEQQIIHRDITSDNILLEEGDSSSKENVKIIDFGIAHSRKKSEHESSTRICIGTPAYMAPEIVMDNTLFDHRVDIYSVGVLFFELMYGEFPAYHEDIATLFSLKISRAWEHSPYWQKAPWELVFQCRIHAGRTLRDTAEDN
jgi:serine/threonine protein kinase